MSPQVRFEPDRDQSASGASHTVRFEPIGVEIECGSEETVLDAAFRQGLNLVYGCREGQCSACKCFLQEGDVALKRYSNFALSDSEAQAGYSLMCRAMPEQDLVVELLHYDPDALTLEHPIRDGEATVESVRALTADITGLVLRAEGFQFTPGQYVDLHVPGDEDPAAKRSFSLANQPGEDRIELIIKRYPGGRFSALLEDQIKPGDTIRYTGPYGSLRARDGEAPILMIAGGSGMAPILSLLGAFAAGGCERPVRFFYGARTEQDLFGLDQIAALGEQLSDFRFTPVTERFVHEAVDEFLTDSPEFSRSENSNPPKAGPDVYMCGPPPMIEAAEEMLTDTHGLDEQHIFIDKFTTAAETAGDSAEDSRSRDFALRNLARAEGPGDESERQFDWYQPRARRASLYEDVTIDTQPSPHRHLTRGWPLHFEDGRGTWDDSSTALRCVDWFAFRDPGEQWERTFYRAGAAVEQQIEGALRSASEEGLLADFSAEWVAFLRHYLQAPAFVEHGLWLALATAARDGLSDSVSTCMALQAATKQRSAQAIVLYAMDLEDHFPDGFPIEPARRAFLDEEPWQPTRRYLERLATTADWCEVIVAANLCLEPVVGTLIRRELGTRAAAANGDTITPVLARAATQEWESARAWTLELTRMLLADPEHGAANRSQLVTWIGDWLPEALAAALALVPIAEAIPTGIDIPRAIERVRRYTADLLGEAELPELAQLVGIELEATAPERVRRTRPTQKPKPRGIAPRAIPQTNRIERPPGDQFEFVGIVMAKSAEGDAVAEILSHRDGIEVLEQASFWDIRAKDRLEIPYAEVSEELGYEIDAYSIQHEMSTHYGRMVAGDDALLLFSDPTEAMQYLMS